MPVIALVPAQRISVERGKFSNAEALSGIPDDWRPRSERINPESFPSPYGRHEATRLLCGRGEFREPLARASAALLKGLVGGLFFFRWLTPKDVRSEQLRSLLDSTLSDAWPFLGLITDGAERVWGYTIDGPVPVLAGARDLEVDQLVELVSKGVNGDIVRRLLAPIREDFVRKNRWTPNERRPWMALLNEILGESGPAESDGKVDIRSDIRCWGPFPFASGEASAQHTDYLYLPVYAPNFVSSLAHAFATDRVSQPDGAGLVELRSNDRASPGVRLVSRDVELAEPRRPLDGVAVGPIQWSGQPPGDLRVALDRSQGLTIFDDHCRASSADVRDVDSRPHLFSDVQRMVATYLPERMGGDPMSPVSRALQEFLRKRGAPGVVSDSQSRELRDSGLAFQLEDSPHSHLFVESWLDSPPHAIGDLSTLGMALWLTFVRETAADGHPWIRHQEEGFPFQFHPEMESRFSSRAHLDRLAMQLASLQRFARSHIKAGGDPDKGGWEELRQVAAASFLKRVFASRTGEDATLESLRATRRPITAPAGEAFGRLVSQIDPFRFSDLQGK